MNIIINPIYLIAYLLIINLLTIFVYGTDKLWARANAPRISEKSLLILAIIGGSLGAFIAVKIFHHKTNKARFLILLLTILLTQIILIYYLFYQWVLSLGPVSIDN